MEFQKTTTKVSDKDKQFLRKRAYLNRLFPVLFTWVLAAVVIFFMVLMDFVLIAWLAGAVVLLISFMMVSSSLRFVNFMSQKKKTIVKGTITDKFKKLGGQTVPLRAGKDNIRHPVYCYFKFGEHQVKVDTFFYRKYKKGDTVELQFIDSPEHTNVPLPVSHTRLELNN